MEFTIWNGFKFGVGFVLGCFMVSFVFALFGTLMSFLFSIL